MASARFAWGIDIGNRALKAIRLSRGDAGLRIDDFEVIEHENVLSNAGDNRDALIQNALANFVQRHPTKGGVAAISVSGVSSFSRFVKLPPVEPKKIPEIVKFEAIQQIPFPLDEVEWSYQLFQTPDSPEVQVGIFAMRRELINSHIKHFTDVGLNVQYVQMNPLAVYNAMYYDGRLKGTTMIVDLGAENTDLIIADGETIWTRSIPIGGNNFTEVLVKSFKLPFAKAEELKRNAATSKYARQIFQAMRPVFADLVAEIQRSMGFYASVQRDSRIKKIIALGGTFRLPGLQKYLQQNLQLEVERMDRLAAGAPEDGKLATTFNENLLSLVSAYGLAIQAMGEGKITSSLLPMHIRRENMRDKTKWFGAAAAGFVLGAAVACGTWYVLQLGYHQAQSIRDVNDSNLRDAKSLDQQWKTQIETAGDPARQVIKNVRTMLAGRNMWPNLVSDVFNTLPPPPPGLLQPDAANIKILKDTPRNERNILLIDQLQTDYHDNLPLALVKYQHLAPAAAAPGTPPTPPMPGQPDQTAAAPVDANVPPGSSGFVITLNLVTPHAAGYLYVLQNYEPKLAAMNRDWMDKYNEEHPQDKKNYYIAKVSDPFDAEQLKDDTNQMSLMLDSYNAALTEAGRPSKNTPAPAMPTMPGGQFGPRRGGAGSPPSFVNPTWPQPPAGGGNGVQGAALPDDAPYLDRTTNEDRRLDWEMKIQIVVIVNPPAKQ